MLRQSNSSHDGFRNTSEKCCHPYSKGVMTLLSIRSRFAHWTMAASVIFALAFSIVAFHFQAQPAYASSCISPTLHYYPGSPSSHVRYGEVDFHFFVCSSDAPSSWIVNVSRASVNGTGK